MPTNFLATVLLTAALLPGSVLAMGKILPSDPTYAEAGASHILNPQMPAVALDVAGMVTALGTGDGVRNYVEQVLQQLPQGYQLFALDSSGQALRGDRPTAPVRRVVGLLKHYHVPYLRNDFAFTPFHDDEERFSEAQLEKLKTIKFAEAFPIVGVISRPVLAPDAYVAAGISVIPFGQPVVGELAALERNHLDYDNGLLNPNHEQWVMDGLTHSRDVSGNSIAFQTESPAAAQTLLGILEGAETFIHLSNYALEDDPFGRKVAEVLERKAKAGVRVRMIIDRICMGPYGSDNGLVWLTQRMVDELRTAGVDLRFHQTVQKDQGMPTRILERRHRKWVVADRTVGGHRSLVAFGGSRVLASFAFENTPGRPLSALEKLLGVGVGPHWEFSFTVAGPMVEKIESKFESDFRSYGGSFATDELAVATATQSRLAPNTTLRYVMHDTFMDQNCVQTLMRLMAAGKDAHVVIVNSFVPGEPFVRALEAAAKAGARIDWIMGGVHFQFKERIKLIPRLFKAGIHLYLMPVQLQTKLYGNDQVWAFGTHNLVPLSQRDSEDLMVMGRTQSEAAAIDAYVESLKQQAHALDEWIKPGAPAKDVTEFAKAALTPAPADISAEDEHREHSVGEALSDVWKFLVTAPFAQ